MADYVLKDHKPSANQGKARLRGLYQIIYSKTIYNSKTDDDSKTDDAFVAVIVTLLRIGCDDHASAYRSGFFWKPLHSFSRSGLQNDQTPPSPLVGERGRGNEGRKRTGTQKITDLSQ